MSDPRAMAARMTNFKPVDYRDMLGGGALGLGITGLDVAGAMAMGGAGEGETLMVLAKWVQDTSAQARLFYVVYDDVMELAAREKWRVPKGEEYLRRLTRLAIAEIIDVRVCPSCSGTRYDTSGRVPVICAPCGGSGRTAWTPAIRYHAAGIHGCNWYRTWAPRYKKIMGVVGGYEERGLASLRGGLG